MEAPSDAPRAADETLRPATQGTVLGLTALAGAAAAALGLARGRALADALGADLAALAAGAVLLAFALGAGTLGLGARRARRPLTAGGVLLLTATAFTLLWPAGLAHLGALDAGAPLLLLGLWLLLGPPAFLAGAALPFAARALEDRAQRPAALALGAALLGAGAGRWIAAFHLTADVGLDATANAATALGLVLGVVAVALGRAPARAPAGSEPQAAGDPAPDAGLGAAAALLGAAALALERLGARELDLVAGPTARSAWAATAAFGVLLGAGVLLSAAFARARAPLAAGLGALLAVLSGIARLSAAPRVGIALGALGAMRTQPAQDEALLALAALAQGAPALGLGLVFGTLIGAERRVLQRALAAAALGAVAAVLLLELGPPLERQVALRAALALVPLAAALRFRPGAQPVVAFCALLAAGALALTWGSFGPRDRLLGNYLGDLEARFELVALRPSFTAEGARADVLVLAPEAGGEPRALLVDGRRVGGGGERALGWLPRLLHPRARRALVDGLGSGYVARALLDLGALEVVCAEPLDALVAAAERSGPLAGADPAVFTRVREDLRRHLCVDGPRYDLMLVDATAPWTRGATARLSTEFFQAAGARLEAYGLVAVALPTRSLRSDQLARVIRTATGVFPDAALLDAGEGVALLVCTPRGLVPRVEEVDAAQALLDARPEAAAEIAARFGSSDVRTLLLERLWLGVEPLRAFAASTGNGELIADTDLSLELEAFHGALFAVLAVDLLRAENERTLFGASDPEFRRRLFVDWRAAAPQLDALRAHKTRCFKNRQFEQGLALVQLALTYEPDDPEFGADLLLFGDLDPQAFEARRERLLRRSPAETYRLGSSLAQLGRLAAARAVLAGLVERHPQSATALVALADVLEALGETERASQERARARTLDPLNDAVLAARPPR